MQFVKKNRYMCSSIYQIKNRIIEQIQKHLCFLPAAVKDVHLRVYCRRCSICRNHNISDRWTPNSPPCGTAKTKAIIKINITTNRTRRRRARRLLILAADLQPTGILYDLATHERKRLRGVWGDLYELYINIFLGEFTHFAHLFRFT